MSRARVCGACLLARACLFVCNDRGLVHQIAAEPAVGRRDAALGVREEDVARVSAVCVEGDGAGQEVGRQPDVVLHDGDEGTVGEQQACRRRRRFGDDRTKENVMMVRNAIGNKEFW
jgi:hypothetical protein